MPENERTDHAARIQRLREALAAQNLQALWVTAPTNVRYLTGFTHPDDGTALVTPSQVVLYTDARYTVQAADDAAAGVDVRILRPVQAVEDAAALVEGLKVGVEAEAISLAAFQRLEGAWKAQLSPTSGLVETLRLRKSEDELAGIRAAQDLADRVFAATRPHIKAGATETEIAMRLENAMREVGAMPAFDTIVASGARGAYPHGTASDKVIQNGELVTIDFGAALNGYNSDMTRTVAVGTPPPELQRMYMAVLEAEQAAVQSVKAGVKAAELDTIAREVLERHGLLAAFTHSLGHGVGLEVHEGPRLAPNVDDVLEAGMVVTVEPGVYVEGVGGIRIEDLVLVTEDGYEVLSRSEIERFE